MIVAQFEVFMLIKRKYYMKTWHAVYGQSRSVISKQEKTKTTPTNDGERRAIQRTLAMAKMTEMHTLTVPDI